MRLTTVRAEHSFFFLGNNSSWALNPLYIHYQLFSVSYCLQVVMISRSHFYLQSEIFYFFSPSWFNKQREACICCNLTPLTSGLCVSVSEWEVGITTAGIFVPPTEALTHEITLPEPWSVITGGCKWTGLTTCSLEHCGHPYTHTKTVLVYLSIL